MVAAKVCAKLATRQHGVVHRAQLIEAGVSPGVTKRLLRAGHLHRLHRGVYAVGHLALPPLAKEQAALLACGASALISDVSALYVWGIRRLAPPDVHVTIAGGHCRKRPGIRRHLVDAIDNRDIRRRGGLRLTSPARALIEFAAHAATRELEDAVAQARVLGLVREGELEKAIDRAGRVRGATRIRAFLRDEAGPQMTRSEAERRMRALIREAKLPTPEVNVPVGEYEVDFLWREQRVIVEVDGYKFHGHRRTFEADRRKDMALRDAGFVVIRTTWRVLEFEPLVLVAHIARALDRGAGRPHSSG